MTESSFHDTLTEQRKYAIRERYMRITDTVGEKCAKLGIPHPLICAASKTMPAEDINYAASLGLKCIGENRVQEFLSKEEMLSPSLEKHFIGRLQRNKVKYLIGKVSLIHSVDSAALAAEIGKRAAAVGYTQDILLEINIGREPGKGGIMPEKLPELMDEISGFSGVRMCGLMTIAPIFEKKDDYRKFFAETYQILLDTAVKKMHNISVPFLSMGMSGNYDIALEYGANIIRPGSALFGERNYGASV